MEILKESKHKPNELWVDQEKQFYNSLMHKRLDDILMYSTHNEGKSEFAVRFIRNLESIIYKSDKNLILDI